MKDKFKGIRTCKIYCYDCLNEGRNPKYRAKIRADEVHLKNSPVLHRPIPMVVCRQCGGKNGRIMKVYPKGKKTTEEERRNKIIEENKLTAKRIKQNREEYAKKFGKDRAKKDFLQPYKNGEVNKEYVEAYANEDDKLVKSYDSEGIKEVAKAVKKPDLVYKKKAEQAETKEEHDKLITKAEEV